MATRTVRSTRRNRLAAGCILAVATIAALAPLPAAAGTRPVSISVGSATIWEGNSGTRTLNVPVTLSYPANFTVKADYKVVASSSSATTTDFKAVTGTLTFTANATTGLTPTAKTVAIPVYSDGDVEPDESVAVVLSNVTAGITVANAVGVSTIKNDDPNLIYGQQIQSGSASIGESDAGNAEPVSIPVTLSQAASAQVTVAYKVTGGTATAGKDYSGSTSGTLTFPAGTIQKAINLSVLPDAIDEPDEDVVITLSNAAGALAVVTQPTARLVIESGEFRGLSGGPKVGVAGDSITFVSAGAIEASLMPAYRVWLSGQPGFTIAGVQPVITTQVAAGPAAMVVNLGTNDVKPNTAWKAPFDTMVASLQPVACVELVNINATIANYFATVNNDINGNKLIDANEIVTTATDINAAIAAAAAANPRVHVIDWNAATATNASSLTSDGIHPNAAGQAWLASHIRAALDTDCKVA